MQKSYVGMVSGRLTVKEMVMVNGVEKCFCECECGNTKIVGKDCFRKGDTKSCGCLAKEYNEKRAKQKQEKLLNKPKTPKTINSRGDYRGIKSVNRFEFTEEYGIGYTNRGERFYFDLEDYDKIKDHYWYKDQAGYVVSNIYKGKKIIEKLRLHRVVMGLPKYEKGGLVVDHIHHILYDNRKSQLRISTSKENGRNRGKSNGKSRKNPDGVHGVYYYKSVGKYSPQICVDGKCKYLGYYDSFEEALRIRKEAEIEYFGDFRFKDDEEEFEILPP